MEGKAKDMNGIVAWLLMIGAAYGFVSLVVDTISSIHNLVAKKRVGDGKLTGNPKPMVAEEDQQP